MKLFTGAIQDPRGKNEKLKDWSHTEIFGMGTYEWKEMPVPTYTPRYQNGSSRCGGFSGAKALGINNIKDNGGFKNLSPEFIYKKRTNQGAGMFMQDVVNIMVNYGSPLDEDLTCDHKTDAELDAITFNDADTQNALQNKGKAYFTVNIDIDEIAKVISQGNTPIILLRAGLSEYTEFPTVNNNLSSFDVSHFVPAICATLVDGKKYIVIDDSIRNGLTKDNNHRYFSEEFINKRVREVRYVTDLPTGQTDKPQHTFIAPLYYGMNNTEVAWLQKVLAYEGFMPLPKVLGYYGAITANAVKKFQLSRGITDFANENDVTKIKVGKKTLLELNKTYGQ